MLSYAISLIVAMSIKDNIDRIRQRIEAAAAQSAFSAPEVCMVCVTKNRTIHEIFQALDAGITHIAENRVQEAQVKFEAVRAYARTKGISPLSI